MNLICLHCGKSFGGEKTKFCSQSCMNSHVTSVEKRIREAVSNDSSHTSKISRD